MVLRDAKDHCRLSVGPVTSKFNSNNKITFCCTFLSKNVKIKINISLIFPTVSYGFESWSITMRDECGLRVFEKRLLRKRGRDNRGMGENA